VPKWGLPTVADGDEPHYLVLLNSLILDGDFDLHNNYLAVHQGSNQAGTRYASSGVDHHTIYWVGDHRFVWRELFNANVEAWPRDSGGHLVPQLKPGVDPAFSWKPESPAHPVGVALLLAPLVFPLRGTGWLEHVVVFCSALATLLAVYFYQRILEHFTPRRSTVWITTAAVFLATPLLFYSRSFFNEPLITLFITAAFALALTTSRSFWAGACLGLAMLMKPQSLIVAPALSLLFLKNRDIKSLLLFWLVPIVATLLNLYFNYRLNGSPWHGAYPFYRGSFWEGTWGLVGSQRHGLLWFAPALVFSAFGWRALLRIFRLEALVLLLGAVLLFGIAAWWAYWDGGWCYGPRLITPAFPLLGAGLVWTLEHSPFTWRPVRWGLYGVISIGVLINFLAATHHASSFEVTILDVLRKPLNR